LRFPKSAVSIIVTNGASPDFVFFVKEVVWGQWCVGISLDEVFDRSSNKCEELCLDRIFRHRRSFIVPYKLKHPNAR
jgi:hypothetical protein